MATEVGDLYYDLTLDDKKLGSQLSGADKKVQTFGDRIGQYWGKSVQHSRIFMLGLAAAGAATVAFGVSSLKAFQESQEVMAQTNAVLKSTGGIAGVTAEQVTKLASSLQSVTKFSDEQIQSGENLLLTFTKIGKDIFPQATETMLDMSQALGQDTKSSAIQLGKALQDPILGVTALRRVGVNFNSKQQEVIKNLVETGKQAEAQRLILKELNVEFGGSARAAGQTLGGQLTILKNKLNDAQEAIGGLMAQAITPFIQKSIAWFDSIGGVEGVMDRLRLAFERIRPHIPIIAGAIVGILMPALLSMAGAIAGFLLVVAPWAAAGAGIVLLFQRMKISFDDVRNAISIVVGWFQIAWNWLTNLISPINILRGALSAARSAFAFVRDVVSSLVSIFMTWLWPSIKALADAVWTQLIPSLASVWSSVMRLWRALNPALLTALKVVGAIIGVALVGALWIAINVLNVAAKAFGFIAKAISTVVGWISNLISWFGTAATAVYRFQVRALGFIARLPAGIQSAMAGAAEAIIGPFRAAFDWLSEQVDRVKGILNRLNPFHRESPSLIDNITRGTSVMVDQYRSAFRAIEQIASRARVGVGAITPQFGLPTQRLATVGSAPAAGASIGPTTVNIGTINDRADADYVLQRIDRNHDLSSMGLTPARRG